MHYVQPSSFHSLLLRLTDSDSRGDIAYMLCDISGVSEEEVKDIYESISSTSANILTRLLY